MKKYIGLIIIMVLFVGGAIAQPLLEGGVREKVSGNKMADVIIRNINNKELTLTDKNGKFKIRAVSGQRLIFSSPGYISDTLYLVNIKPKFVEMLSAPMALSEVNVSSRRLAFDPHAEYPDVYEKAKIYPLSPSTIFSRESRNARKLKKYFVHEEQDRYIDSKYTKVYVSGILPLKGQELEEFISMSRPTYDFLKKTDGVELVLYVNDKYKEFKVMPQGQQSLQKVATP
jgi:hypothetical protein